MDPINNYNRDSKKVSSQTYSINESTDFWRYDIGVNVIPSDTMNKKPIVTWSEWQDKPVPEQLHNAWKEQGAFSQGIAIIPGKVWHNENKKELYFIFIDADKQKAIDELCTRSNKVTSLQEMSKKFLVEQHKDNPEKAHIYFYSPIPFLKKNTDSAIGLEVKGLGEHGIAFCFPSTHKDGMPYEIIGTNQPAALTIEQARELMQHINQICIKYDLQYLGRETPSPNISSNMRNIIENLVIDTTLKIPQGQRHVTLISAVDSLLFRHLGKGKNKSEKWLRDFFEKINYQLCDPEPLLESEIDSIWNSALEFVNRIRDKEEQNENDDNDSESDSHSKSYAETLLKLATENIQLLFKDQYGTAYAVICLLDHNEILKVESDKFKRYLAQEQCKIDINHKLWPKSPNVLSRRLNQIRSNLLEGLGIEVIISRVTTSTNGGGKANTSYLKIRKISPVSPIPPVKQNHEGNYDKTTGDISSTGDIISPVDKIPPVENYQNHAQKSAIGDTGHTGDILPTSMEGYTKLVGNSIDTATMIIPQQQQEQEQQQKQFRFECYYCNTFRTDIRKDYESHVLLRHPGKPCYPSKADLDKFGLDVKRKEWET